QHSKEKADQRERRLHRGSTLVGGLPFRKQRAILQRQPGRLLHDIHIKRNASKYRRHDQREKPEDHDRFLPRTNGWATFACTHGRLYLTNTAWLKRTIFRAGCFSRDPPFQAYSWHSPCTCSARDLVWISAACGDR